MKKTLFVACWVFVSYLAYSQQQVQAGGGLTLGGTANLGGVAAVPPVCGLTGFPLLPDVYAVSRDPRTVCASFAVTKVLGVNYPATPVGVNQAILDYVTGPDQCTLLSVPHATFGTSTPFNVNSVITLLGKPGATKYMFIKGDGAITDNQIPCSHKFVDNNDGTSPRDLSCTHDIAQFATFEGNFVPGNKGMVFDACQIGAPNCAVGPNHYVIENMELRFQAGNSYSGQGVNLVNLNDGDTSGLLGSSDIWLFQDYLHADAGEVPTTAANRVATMVNLTGCARCGLIDVYVDKVVQLNGESHIVTAQWSPGPLKIAEFWFEGSSIPILTGGAGTTVLPYENVFNFEIGRGRTTKSPQWKNLPTSSQIAEKSGGEFKVCTKCWLDGVILENNNTTGSQKGQGWTLTVRNTSGGAMGDNYNNDVSNITISNSWFRHNVSGIETAARSSGAGNGGGAAQPGHDWAFYNLLFTDTAPGSSVLTNTTVNIPFIVEAGAGGNTFTATGVCDAAGANATLTLLDGGTGLHESTMNPGDLVHVKSCSDASFNTPIHGASFAGKGPIASVGTTPTSPTPGIAGVTKYPIACTPNGTATGCLISNEQGFQRNQTARHITAVGAFIGSGGGPGQVPSCLSIDGYAQGFNFSDNLILPQPGQYSGLKCQGNGNSEGTSSEADMFDTSTGTFTNNVLGPNLTGGVTVARNLSLYTDWPSGVTPSVANWAPAKIVCTAATVGVEDCVGMVGMMSGAPYDANDLFIQAYGLVADSPYRAGGPRQATDGKQVGAIITDIQTHFAATQGICLNPGGVGPQPD